MKLLVNSLIAFKVPGSIIPPLIVADQPSGILFHYASFSKTKLGAPPEKRGAELCQEIATEAARPAGSSLRT
ncbi:MAG TPA: hypothetical protein VG324_05960, partial [Blastocatellia bacterium]|nr:hypothetical protein [Blastocatellia bacterium]